MRCHRCQSTMVQTSIEAHHASIQQWFSCPLCSHQSMRTVYHESSASIGGGPFAPENPLRSEIDLPHPGQQ